MAMWVGTSGYNYPEWRGTFYPEKFPAAKMLPYYAERFNTVEINYTFYRMPNAKILAGWSEATPEPFKLTLKAPKRITHTARLKDCEELLQYFVKTANTLGPKLGILFFQLPQAAHLRDLQPAAFAAPGVEGRVRDPVTPTQLRHLPAGLGLLRNRDDLFFAKPCSVSCLPSFPADTNSSVAYLQGERPQAMVSKRSS